MGQGVSSGFDELPRGRKCLSEALWAKALLFPSPQNLWETLDSDVRFNNLGSLSGRTTFAEYKSRMVISTLTLTIDLLSRIVSFDAPMRPGSESRVAGIEESMIRHGIKPSSADSVMTVSLERNADAKEGEELSFILVDGYKRCKAFLRLLHACETGRKHESMSNLRATKVQVEVMYAAKCGMDARINAAIVANQCDKGGTYMNLADMWTMVSLLRKSGRSVKHIRDNCALFSHLDGEWRQKRFVEVVWRVASCERTGRIINRYFSDVVDDSPEPFLSPNNIHEETEPIRRQIHGATEYFYTRWVTTHQTRGAGAVLASHMTEATRGKMMSCVPPLGAARSILISLLKSCQVDQTSSTPEEVGAMVDEVMRTMLDVAWGDWIGTAGEPMITSDPSALFTTGGTIHNALREALRYCEKNHDDSLITRSSRRALREIAKMGSSAEEKGLSQKSILSTVQGDDTHIAGGDAHGISAHPDQQLDIPTESSAFPAKGPLESTPPARSSAPESRTRSHSAPPKIAVIGLLTEKEVGGGVRSIETGFGGPHQGVSLFVWHVGFSGTPNILANLLIMLRGERLLSPSLRILLFEGVRSRYGQAGPETRSWGESEGMKRAREEVVRILQPKSGSGENAVAMEVRVGDSYCVNDMHGLEGCDYKQVSTIQRPEETDIYRATIVYKEEAKVTLHREDPSIYDNVGGNINTNVLSGASLCRASEPRSVSLISERNEAWDRYTSTEMDNGGDRLKRDFQPSMVTYMSLIYRTGATLEGGQMFVSFDPHAAWAEAAVACGMSCVTWVGFDPPRSIQSVLTNVKVPASPTWKRRSDSSSLDATGSVKRPASSPPSMALATCGDGTNPPSLFFVPWTNNNCHWACWIPVLFMLRQLDLIPDAPQGLTVPGRCYFNALAEVMRDGLEAPMTSARQNHLEAIRKILLKDEEGSDSMGDPMTLIRTLIRTDSSKVSSENLVVHETGVAMGIALTWQNVGCPKHEGQIETFETWCRDADDGSPLRLKYPWRHGLTVQQIIDSMSADTTACVPSGRNAGSAGDDWHVAERYCIGCRDEGLGFHPVRHRLVLDSHGPSHFIAEVPQTRGSEVANVVGDKKGTGGHLKGVTGRCDVKPSLALRVFGEVYMLCAIVYHRPPTPQGSSHFVAQVYSPRHRWWLTCDSLTTDGKGQGGPRFDDQFSRGEEYLLVYVRHSVLQEKTSCVPQIISVNEESSHTPLDSIVKREDGRPEYYMKPSMVLDTVLGQVGPEALEKVRVRRDDATMGNLTLRSRRYEDTHHLKLVLFELHVVSPGTEIVSEIEEPAGPGEVRGERHIVTSKSLKTLRGRTWVSDECITAYFGLLNIRAHEASRLQHADGGDLFISSLLLSTLKDDLTSLRAVRTANRLRVHPLRARRIFVAHHVRSAHWNLIVVDTRAKEVRCYDSLPFGAQDSMRTLLSWLGLVWEGAADEERKGSTNPRTWRIAEEKEQEEYIRQVNDSDCGVFLLCFANKLSLGCGLDDVRAHEMRNARMKIASQILEMKL